MYIMHNGKKYSTTNAKNISFDNIDTSLESTNVQDSIIELNKNLKNKLGLSDLTIAFPYTGWFAMVTNHGTLYVRCTSDTTFSQYRLIAYDKNYNIIWTL